MLDQAAALLKAGRPAEAIPFLTKAAGQNPTNPALHHDLGLAHLEAGHLHEAAAALQHATALNPRYTDAHFRLAIALEKLGQNRAAIAAYDRTTELLPSHTEAWYRAGALVYTLSHITEAILCFKRAASSGPKTSFGRLGAARALLAQDRDAEAEKPLRQTLALDPGNALAHDLLGNLLADSGRFGEAETHLARAIAAAPLLAGSYYDLVRCRRLTQQDAPLLAQMQAALANPGLDGNQQIRVHLALGKAADDLGDHEAAMGHYHRAHAVRSAVSPFNAAAFDSEVTRLIEQFPAPIAGGNPDSAPILIMGLPRSGTTLVEQIVSAHPMVAAGGELNFWNERAPASIDKADLAEAAADYLALLGKISSSAAHVTDKMPFNFLWAGLIHRALPNATLIHCRRAAIDTALSIHQTHFNPNLALPTGGPELVGYIHSYERLMAHWRATLPANRFVEISYEQLTSAPGAEIPRLIAACQLPWNESCLQPERNPRIVKTASKWQARQPITAPARNRWRRYESWLGSLRVLAP